MKGLKIPEEEKGKYLEALKRIRYSKGIGHDK